MVMKSFKSLEVNCRDCGRTHWIAGADQMQPDENISCLGCFADIGTVAELTTAASDPVQPTPPQELASSSRESV